MQVYLIRHAQSENNVLTKETLHRRQVDPDLTELGYVQRERLAEYLASDGFNITRLYTSAMYRALLTTETIGVALDLKPIVWLDLHEKGGLFRRRNGTVNGVPGLTRAKIRRLFPGFQLPKAVSETGWYDTTLGCEPETHSFFRAIKVAKELQQWRQTDEAIALVSHAGFLDIFLKAIFAQLPSQPHSLRYYHNNTAITRVGFDRTRPALHYLNRVDHLPLAMSSF